MNQPKVLVSLTPHRSSQATELTQNRPANRILSTKGQIHSALDPTANKRRRAAGIPGRRDQTEGASRRGNSRGPETSQPPGLRNSSLITGYARHTRVSGPKAGLVSGGWTIAMSRECCALSSGLLLGYLQGCKRTQNQIFIKELRRLDA